MEDAITLILGLETLDLYLIAVIVTVIFLGFAFTDWGTEPTEGEDSYE